MRLRQVALIAHQIAPVAEALQTVFGLKVGFRDPAVGVFGLANVVMPAGGDFIEVLEPMRPDTAGGRYLARRGGDAGYMVILQDDDALAHRRRLEAARVRVIAARGDGRYRFTHYHPADCAGILLSIDCVEGADWRERAGDWPPAGPAWREFECEGCGGLAAVTIQHRDPEAAANRWSLLLDRPVISLSGGFAIELEMGAIRFVPAMDEDGTGVVGIDVAVADVSAVLDRAAAEGLASRDGSVLICGTAFTPVASMSDMAARP